MAVDETQKAVNRGRCRMSPLSKVARQAAMASTVLSPLDPAVGLDVGWLDGFHPDLPCFIAYERLHKCYGTATTSLQKWLAVRPMFKETISKGMIFESDNGGWEYPSNQRGYP